MSTREAVASPGEPVWHVRIDVSLYVGGPIFRASPALFGQAEDQLRPSDLDPGMDHLRDFMVTASVGSHDGDNRLWGYRHGYSEPFFVDRHRIEPMVETLRRIDTGLDVHRARCGDVDESDPVGYLTVIAAILKIPTFVVRAEGEDGRDGRWADGRRHRLFDADALRTVITAQLRDLGDLA